MITGVSTKSSNKLKYILNLIVIYQMNYVRERKLNIDSKKKKASIYLMKLNAVGEGYKYGQYDTSK